MQIRPANTDEQDRLPPPSPSAGAKVASFFLITPQVLEAVLVVLKSAATRSLSMSISGGDFRQCQAALRTRSSFSVKSDFSVLCGEESLVGEVDMVNGSGRRVMGVAGRGLVCWSGNIHAEASHLAR